MQRSGSGAAAVTEGVYLSRGMSVEETRARLRAGEAEDGKPDADAYDLANEISEQTNDMQSKFSVTAHGLRLLIEHLSDLSINVSEADALARLLEAYATAATETHWHKLVMSIMHLERLL
jgi:hypothetical protein